MRLTKEQLQSYEDDGLVLLPEYFSAADIGVLKDELSVLLAEDTPRRVVEKSGAVRSLYGSHLTNEVFGRLSKHSKIVEPAMQIVASPVYVYQFKINAKVAFSGDVWEWHQDYVFWLKEDGMPAARATNAVIFLDEVNEFNAPVFFIPGSHKEGIIDVAAHDEPHEENGRADDNGYDRPWISNLTANLKYSLSKETVTKLVTKYGMVAPKGGQGSVLFFDSNLVHGSTNNISPFDRTIVLVTFNSIANVPPLTADSRPDFLASRNSAAIVAPADSLR